MNQLDITQSKARTLVKKICKDFDISLCKVWFININDRAVLGWYSDKRPNFFAYIMIEKKWDRRFILLLHELTHHIQQEKYEYDDEIHSPHGKTFTLAKKRVATWVRKNVSTKFDWEYMITTYDGRRKK